MIANSLREGLNLYHMETAQFKTFHFSLYFHRQLQKEEVSLNALLPYVLKQGSRHYPSGSAVYQELESLYGGTFDVTVRKKGDDQVLGFHFEFVSPTYIPNDSGYLDRVLSFVFDPFFHPLKEGEGFSTTIVEREKKNLDDYIHGVINDKKEYADLRCKEEMFQGEPFSLFEYGLLSTLEEITPKALYQHFKKVLSQSKIDAFLIGDVSKDAFVTPLSRLPQGEHPSAYPSIQLKELPKKVREVKEKMPVAQGKLSMGFVTGIAATDPQSLALTVANSVFGSGAHSKLFNHVREKLSLCYYAYSRVDKFKGILTVSSGVEFKNFKAAHDEILLQLQQVKNGNITKEELTAAKGSLINTLLSMKDNPAIAEDYYLNGAVGGKSLSVSEYIQGSTKNHLRHRLLFDRGGRE